MNFFMVKTYIDKNENLELKYIYISNLFSL